MKWHEQLISHFGVLLSALLPALIGGLILGFRNVIGDVPMSNSKRWRRCISAKSAL